MSSCPEGGSPTCPGRRPVPARPRRASRAALRQRPHRKDICPRGFPSHPHLPLSDSHF